MLIWQLILYSSTFSEESKSKNSNNCHFIDESKIQSSLDILSTLFL